MGCWRASGDHLVSTASLLLLAFLCGGAGMGLWHGAKFYEMEKVTLTKLEIKSDSKIWCLDYNSHNAVLISNVH